MVRPVTLLRALAWRWLWQRCGLVRGQTAQALRRARAVHQQQALRHWLPPCELGCPAVRADPS
jgi:hypothetical protein